MKDHIVLLGAEQVEKAALVMAEAAQTIRRAVGDLDFALTRHQAFLERWKDDFETMLQETIDSALPDHRDEEEKDEEETTQPSGIPS